MRPLSVVVLALLTVAGCASTVRIDVGYPEAGVHRSLLAAGGPRQIVLGPITTRSALPRIGVDPDSDKPLVTRRPVTDIVRDALSLELGKNGHALVAEAGDVAVAAAVEEFWLDVVEGYKGALYVGKVAIALTVTDGVTGRRLLDRQYVGIKRQRTDSDSKAAEVAREVMDAALARAMRDLATDRELVAVLARPRSAAAARGLAAR